MAEIKYFAVADKEKIGDLIMKRIDDHYEYLENSRLKDKIRNSYLRYNGFNVDGSDSSREVLFMGDEEELTKVSVNHYGNLINHMSNLITETRPSVDVISENSDVDSMEQANLGNQLIETTMKQKGLDYKYATAVLDTLVESEAFVFTEWDPFAGEIQDVQDESLVSEENPEDKTDIKRPLFAGDPRIHIGSTLDVIREKNLRRFEDRQWLVFRRFENKHDVAAKYPEMADKILNITPHETRSTTIRPDIGTEDKSDIVPVFYFFHEKSAIIPKGRQVILLSGDCVLFDDTLESETRKYRRIPIHRMYCRELRNTPYATSFFWDLLAPQQIIDMIYSCITSNANAFGVQNLRAPEGSKVRVSSLDGLNVYYYNPKYDPPEPMNLLQTPPELFDFLKALESGVMEILSGIGSVVRGQPNMKNLSGQALALISSQSVQFASQFAATQSSVIENSTTDLLNIYKDNAKIERVEYLAGKSKAYMARAFTGSDLKNISRTSVVQTNPANKTASGKQQTAQLYINRGWVQSPEQYMQVVNTGTLEPLTQGEITELMNIATENEELRAARPVRAIRTDDHPIHIKEHKAVIADPVIRRTRPDILDTTLAHISEHEILGGGALAEAGDNPPAAGNPGMQEIETGGEAPPVYTPMEPGPNPAGVPLPINPLTGQQAPNPGA